MMATDSEDRTAALRRKGHAVVVNSAVVKPPCLGLAAALLCKRTHTHTYAPRTLATFVASQSMNRMTFMEQMKQAG